MPLIIIALLSLLLSIWWMTEPQRASYRRKNIIRQPFPSAWRKIIQRNVPYVRLLPADLQLKLKERIQLFVAEKPFIGCGGLTITDEIRVTVAALACLLIVNRPDYHYPNVHQVLVYPDAFVVNRSVTDAIGVLQNQSQVLSGESWAHERVILSWRDALEGAAIVDDGRNVVICEFAHQQCRERLNALDAVLRVALWHRSAAAAANSWPYRHIFPSPVTDDSEPPYQSLPAVRKFHGEAKPSAENNCRPSLIDGQKRNELCPILTSGSANCSRKSG